MPWDYLDIFQKSMPVGVCESQRQWNLTRIDDRCQNKLLSSKYKTYKSCIVYCLD